MIKAIQYLKNNPSFAIGMLMILLIVCYASYTQFKLRSQGVITIAKVEKFEIAEQGFNVYITIYFRGKQYKTMVDAPCYGCEGKYFFIKIIMGNPSRAPHLYDDKQVPSCILRNPLPFNGWKEIPEEPCN